MVSNSAGSVTSNAATLTVNAAPVAPSITTQPASQTVTAGQTATFSVTATGTAPLSYQWSKNGAAISGATSSSYTTPATTTADNGAQFTVVVSNSVGNVDQQCRDADGQCRPGGAFDHHAAGQPDGHRRPDRDVLGHRHRHRAAQLSVEEERNSHQRRDFRQLTPPRPTTTADNGAQFTVVVSNSAGNVTSNAATLTVNAAPGALDHHAACQPDHHRRPDRHVLGDRHGHGAAQLSVEEERHCHQRRDFVQLHHSCGNHFR